MKHNEDFEICTQNPHAAQYSPDWAAKWSGVFPSLSALLISIPWIFRKISKMCVKFVEQM